MAAKLRSEDEEPHLFVEDALLPALAHPSKGVKKTSAIADCKLAPKRKGAENRACLPGRERDADEGRPLTGWDEAGKGGEAGRPARMGERAGQPEIGVGLAERDEWVAPPSSEEKQSDVEAE